MARARTQTAEWSLDPGDVSWSLAGGGGGQPRRQPRIGYQTLTLRHLPTGIEVSGELPQRERPYSKKEAAALRRSMYPELFSQLEREVARALRIPGR